VEQFDVSRDQIAEIERKSDNRSTTVLVGMAHVILHVRLADNSIRQVRLHVEGLWHWARRKRRWMRWRRRLRNGGWVKWLKSWRWQRSPA